MVVLVPATVLEALAVLGNVLLFEIWNVYAVADGAVFQVNGVEVVTVAPLAGAVTDGF